MDGGKRGFGAVLYMSVKNNMDSPELTHRVLVSKSRVARRTIVCHEALSKPLGMKTLIGVAKVLSTRPEFEDAPMDFILANDSVCSALIYKHGLDVKNLVPRILHAPHTFIC